MTRYLMRRLLQAVPTFLGITLITFIVIKLAPGDPVLQMTFDPKIKAETREKIRQGLGLDKPIAVQYIIWLTGNDWLNWFGEETEDRYISPRACSALTLASPIFPSGQQQRSCLSVCQPRSNSISCL